MEASMADDRLLRSCLLRLVLFRSVVCACDVEDHKVPCIPNLL